MYKLFIAEDEYEIRTGICKYFPWNEIGFDVIGQAENGKQAFDFIQKNSVDVLLCDIKMPIMTGIELAEELFKQKTKIKIIFFSAYRDFEFAQKAISFGVKYYVVKSTKYSELLSVFRKINEELDEENLPKKEETKTPCNDDVHSYNERIVATIKNYITEHFKDVELEDIADFVHMNPFYISKFFKQKTGQNFSEFLLKIKMEKALELLKDIRYKIYEVSVMVGYSNVKNFTRTFKSYYGKSPREFRDNEDIVWVDKNKDLPVNSQKG